MRSGRRDREAKTRVRTKAGGLGVDGTEMFVADHSESVIILQFCPRELVTSD